MDLHPTPFPRKRRPSTISTAKKDSDRPKASKNPPAAADATAAQTRPRRAFGVVRSSNINPVTEKAPTIRSTKPWKPSGVRKDAPSAVATTEKATTPNNTSDGSRSGRITNSNPKKPTRTVNFQEPVTINPISVENAAHTPIPQDASGIKPITVENAADTPILQDASGIKPITVENAAHTPIPQIKPATTPASLYLSAYNCSKCKLDKLESSSYWLTQIKLAESVGKHFVTAVFFRLALECGAQPLGSLLNELKHYVARHRAAISTGTTLWDELCQAYGLSDGQPDTTHPCNCNNADLGLLEDLDEAAHEAINVEESDAICIQHNFFNAVELPTEDTMVNMNSDLSEWNLAEPKEDLGTKESNEAKAMALPFPVSDIEMPSINCQAYGLTDGPSNATDLLNLNKVDPGLFEFLDEACHETIDETLECDATHIDLQIEEPPVMPSIDIINSVPKGYNLAVPVELGTKESNEAKAMPPSSPIDSSGCSPIPHGSSRNKSPITGVSGKKLTTKKPNRVSTVPCIELGSSKTMSGSRGGYAGKLWEASSGTQLGSKLSGGKLTRKNGVGVRGSLRSEQSAKDNEDEKATGGESSENLDSGEAGDNAIIY